jgi:hypothetical protein
MHRAALLRSLNGIGAVRGKEIFEGIDDKGRDPYLRQEPAATVFCLVVFRVTKTVDRRCEVIFASTLLGFLQPIT